MTAMLLPVSFTGPPAVLPGANEPTADEGLTSVIPVPNRSPVNGRAVPAPLVTLRLSPVAPVGIRIRVASKVSRNETSNAPFRPLPVFSTTMQNVTRSLPRTFERFELIGVAARPVELIVPVKPAPG